MYLRQRWLVVFTCLVTGCGWLPRPSLADIQTQERERTQVGPGAMPVAQELPRTEQPRPQPDASQPQRRAGRRLTVQRQAPSVLVLDECEKAGVQTMAVTLRRILRERGFRIVAPTGRGQHPCREGLGLPYDQRGGRAGQSPPPGVDILVRGQSQVTLFPEKEFKRIGRIGGAQATVSAQAISVRSQTELAAGLEQAADPLDPSGQAAIAAAAEVVGSTLSEQLWDTLFPRPSCGPPSGPGLGTGGAGKLWAVVIGIDAYPAHSSWRSLRKAVHDATSLQTRLERFGFDVQVLRNPTRQEILHLLGDVLPRRVQAEDQLVIYYAGHGDVETLPTGEKVAYLVPVDGDPQRPFSSSISLELLPHISQRLCARQIFYIIDSCFSGLSPYTATTGSVRQQGIHMLTAGREGEKAFDGLLAKELHQTLDRAADTPGVMTARELSERVTPQVVAASGGRQHPLFAGGKDDFVFRLPPRYGRR